MDPEAQLFCVAILLSQGLMVNDELGIDKQSARNPGSLSGQTPKQPAESTQGW